MCIEMATLQDSFRDQTTYDLAHSELDPTMKQFMTLISLHLQFRGETTSQKRENSE